MLTNSTSKGAPSIGPVPKTYDDKVALKNWYWRPAKPYIVGNIQREFGCKNFDLQEHQASRRQAAKNFLA